MHLQLKDLLDKLNVANVILYGLLLLLSVLVSLRVEGIITWSYGAVFLPLWIWYLLVVVGATAGIVAWVRNKRLRREPENVYHFKALVLSPILQLPVFLTELLVAINLDTGDHLWRAIFTPLYILPLLYLLPCIWSCLRKRSVEFEILGMCSLLQVVFLGIRLDRVVEWKWALVFIPSYLLLLAYWCVLCARSVYLLLLHLHLLPNDSPQQLQSRSVPDVIVTVCSVGAGVGVTVFMALLTSQLDGLISAPYPAIFIPLYLSFLFLLLSTVSRSPANPWWFGLHRNFSDFVLDVCPVLREYVNISVVPEDSGDRTSSEESGKGSKVKHRPKENSPPVTSGTFPLEDISSPD